MEFWAELLNVVNDIQTFHETNPLAYGVLIWETVVFSVIGFNVLKKITDGIVKKRTKKFVSEKERG